MAPLGKLDHGRPSHDRETFHTKATGVTPSASGVRSRRNGPCVIVSMILVAAIMTWISLSSMPSATNDNHSTINRTSSRCDTVGAGYQCSPEISHFWGQYSPYFTVPSTVSGDIPSGCEVTFAQILSRHGGRDPTKHKSRVYHDTISRIRSGIKKYPGKYKFLAHYKYALGKDQLTSFGEQQMINSGTKYYTRYQHLAEHVTPFVRSSSQRRVVASARKWAEGFHHAKVADQPTHRVDSDYPYDILLLSEAPDSNNSLSHGLCRDFEDGPAHRIGSHARKTWAKIFLPPIQARINSDLGGANLKPADIMVLMDLCPFETVASPQGSISPFCSLFTEEEWHQYDYYQSLGKYYGYGDGNPLGAVQGFGFANELVARLTDQPVNDHTSTNRTLDRNPQTFPLRRQLYADFTHDNDMTLMFAALRLYDSTSPLPNRARLEAPETNGYSAAWTVPFAARVYFEKLRCRNHDEEFVRVLVNDRVIPLESCGGDSLGRCTLAAFVHSLSYTTDHDEWDKCFE